MVSPPETRNTISRNRPRRGRSGVFASHAGTAAAAVGAGANVLLRCAPGTGSRTGDDDCGLEEPAPVRRIVPFFHVALRDPAAAASALSGLVFAALAASDAGAAGARGAAGTGHWRHTSEGADAAEAELLRAMLAALPARHREVIRLRFYADAGEAEIAAALGISPGTVKSRLHDALEKLRRMKEKVNRLRGAAH